MYAGPITLSAIASARPSASSDCSALRSRRWSNHDANISAAQPLTGRSRYRPIQSSGKTRSTAPTAPTSRDPRCSATASSDTV
jgi:hypothetical protein